MVLLAVLYGDYGEFFSERREELLYGIDAGIRYAGFDARNDRAANTACAA
jgi:hypothetical protein